jgi:hypothetical protein
MRNEPTQLFTGGQHFAERGVDARLARVATRGVDDALVVRGDKSQQRLHQFAPRRKRTFRPNGGGAARAFDLRTCRRFAQRRQFAESLHCRRIEAQHLSA